MLAPLDLHADVLVIGGGPAALWTAIAACEAGAQVLLADRGVPGASAVTAGARVAHAWVAPEERARTVAARVALGGGAVDPRAVERTLEQVWTHLPRLAAPGRLAPHPQPRLPGPAYGRLLRRRAVAAGARLQAHAPALELLHDEDGAVRGAAGLLHRTGRPWRASAGATVLATGGGDHGGRAAGLGLLLAAEAGAGLAGMELGAALGLRAAGVDLDHHEILLSAATVRTTGGDRLGWSRPAGPSDELLATEGPLQVRLDRVAPSFARRLRELHPAAFDAFDRAGADPLRRPARVRLVPRGTTTGGGGVVVDDAGWTGVAGLWAAGDVTARDGAYGSATGAGGLDTAWALASGVTAGAEAAEHATAHGPGRGLAPSGTGDAADRGRRPRTPAARRSTGGSAAARARRAVAAAMRPGPAPDAAALLARGAALDDAWTALREAGATGLAGREALAALATARWTTAAALAREETDGLHRRADHPHRTGAGRVRVGGLDELWTASAPARAAVAA